MSDIKEITYSQLDDAVHACADVIDRAANSRIDRCSLNDAITAFLASEGFDFVEDHPGIIIAEERIQNGTADGKDATP